MHSRCLPLMMALFISTISATSLWSQRPDEGGRQGRRGGGDVRERREGPGGPGGRGRLGPPGQGGEPAEMMRLLPIFAALDKDEDGEISGDEIEHATQSLKTLDKNDDGKLDIQELRPDMRAMMERGGGRFGPPGFGGPPGFNRPDIRRRDSARPNSERPDSDARDAGRPGFGSPDSDRLGRGRPQGAPDGAGPSPEAMVDRMMQFDENGDGKLTKDELPELAQARMAEADTNNDGYATKDELIAMAKKLSETVQRDRGVAPEEMVKRLFKESDKDNDGKLTKSEMPDRMAERFDVIDANSDGYVDSEEVTEAMRRFRGAGGNGPQEGRGDRPGRPPSK